MNDEKLRIGIDVGSTTVKLAVLNAENKLIYKRYSRHLSNIFEKIDSIVENCNKRVPTGVLNEIMSQAVALHEPPSDKGKRLRLYYMTQVAVGPPTFVIFVNDKELMHFSYQRYLENQIREVFGFSGTSIKIIVRQRNEKESV